MIDYPYTKILGNLRKFLEGLPRRGVPKIVDRNHLKQAGFPSKNDVGIISILSFLGFIDEKGTPTEDYANFRVTAKQEETMTNAVKNAYSDLFQLYPDAHTRSKQELSDFFTPTTTSGEAVVRLMVRTFRILCKFSTMKQPAPAKPPRTVKPAKTTKKKKVIPKIDQDLFEKEVSFNTKKPLQVVVNIQLVLPESKDPSLYEELFKALKKHLLE